MCMMCNLDCIWLFLFHNNKVPRFSGVGTRLLWAKDSWFWLHFRLLLSTELSDNVGRKYLPFFGSHCNTGNAKIVPSQFVTNDLDFTSGIIQVLQGLLDSREERDSASQLITPFADLHQSHQAPFRLCHVLFLSLLLVWNTCTGCFGFFSASAMPTSSASHSLCKLISSAETDRQGEVGEVGVMCRCVCLCVCVCDDTADGGGCLLQMSSDY